MGLIRSLSGGTIKDLELRDCEFTFSGATFSDFGFVVGKN